MTEPVEEPKVEEVEEEKEGVEEEVPAEDVGEAP